MPRLCNNVAALERGRVTMSAAHKATSKPLKENDKAFAKRQEKEETHASRGRRGPYASRSSTRDVATAIDLFREKGYANASLSELARRMGMDPSSLYYYFSSKAELLASLFKPDMPQASMEGFSASFSCTAQLYALIVQDVVQKCELPLDFIEMEGVARSNADKFKNFFERYRIFYHTLIEVIERGIEKGEFKACEADERAVTILSVNEGLQHHFHAKQRGELLLAVSGYTVRNHTPEDIGNLSALSVIPGLLTDKVDYESEVHQGKRLYALMTQESR